ncbi:ribulose-phosphate 3-epimerase [unidentified bacterial endosymbiont]|uniref:ribulose-phosphate 3-epimerase n=1 Tax=unidentified bacterial endosymbiont TaxID=2355 RepID=UPI00209CE16E|nr:ribulose-phosphate 3-epimerase [unidentified bacterial endosymbiont]
MHHFWIAASILAADFARLGEEAVAALQSGADRIHFDVMDHHYVPNLTVGAMGCQALRHYGITAPIDVHLMVKPVDPLVVKFAQAGATHISFHPEASEHIDRTLQLIREQGCQAGLALNPATPLHCLDYLLNRLDFVLLMAVNPGFGGQTFLPNTLHKISQLRQRIDESGFQVQLSVDGGITADNIYSVALAGCEGFIAGSAIFGQPDYRVAIDRLRDQLAPSNLVDGQEHWSNLDE